MDIEIYQKLAQRVGEPHLRKRLTKQVEHVARFYAKGGYASFHLENVEFIPIVLKFLLKALGIYRRGLKNSIDYRLEHQVVGLQKVPSAFEGFQILQLSDIHADIIHDDGQKLLDLLGDTKPDLAVITGDFRFLTRDAYDKALENTSRMLEVIDAPYGAWGILGNHDFIEFVPELESAGLKMLLNEAVPIRKNGAEIWMAGIDDAHLYDCHDIAKALTGIPQSAFKILLSHTPETYVEAEKAEVDYMLCGHTHGGQICLPGGIPLMTNAKCPRRFCAGAWRYRNMRGYTSRATGSSGLPVRYWCTPEITLHELSSKGGGRIEPVSPVPER